MSGQEHERPSEVAIAAVADALERLPSGDAAAKAHEYALPDNPALAARQPSIMREGGYQGSRDPGRPTQLMKPQVRPVPEAARKDTER